MKHKKSIKSIVLLKAPRLAAPSMWNAPFATLPALTAALRTKGYDVIQKEMDAELVPILMAQWPKIAREKQRIISAPVQKKAFHVAQGLLDVICSGLSVLSKKTALSRLANQGHIYIDRILSQGRAFDFVQNNLNVARSGLDAWSGNGEIDEATRQVLASLSELFWEIPISAAVRGGRRGFFGILDNDQNPPYHDFLCEFAKSIPWEDVSLLGISADSPRQILVGLALSKIIKEAYPHVHVLLGGHATFLIDLYDSEDVRDLKMLLERQLDGVVIYTGETSLLRTIDFLSGRCSRNQIPNLAWLDNGDLRINRPFVLERVAELPPPDFEGIRTNLYDRLPIEASRGCYWAKCIFCHHCYLRERSHDFANDFRRYDSFGTKKIVSNIRYLMEKYGKTKFELACLDMTPRETEKLAKAIIAERLDISWIGRPRLDKSLSINLMDLMADAGVEVFHFYPETFSARTNALLNKGQDMDHVKKLYAHWEANQGRLPPLVTNLIVGVPGETFADFMETYDFIMQGSFGIQNGMNFLHVSKHSPIYYDPENYGLKIEHKRNDWSLFHNYEVKWPKEYTANRAKIRHFLEEHRDEWSLKLKSPYRITSQKYMC